MNNLSYEFWVWLIFGTLCLIWSILDSREVGLFSLRTIAIGAIWVGVFASPFLSLFDGDYECRINENVSYLVHEQIPSVLRYGFFCMCMLSFGWGFVFRRHTCRVVAEKVSSEESLDRYQRWYVPVLVLMIVAGSILFIYSIGGLENLIESSRVRGEGQWDDKTMAVKVRDTVNAFQSIIFVGICLFGAILFSRKNGAITSRALAVGAMWVGSLPGLHNLSRASGIAFAFLGLAGLLQQGRRFIAAALGCFIVCFAMSQIGLTARDNYIPGLGSYFHGASDYIGLGVSNEKDAASKKSSKDNAKHDLSKRKLAAMNPLDQMPPATQLFQAREENRMPLSAAAWGLLTSLNPLPAQFIPRTPFGLETLHERMGTVGLIGLPSPVLPQTYNALGYGGLILWLLLGGILAWVQAIHMRFHSAITLWAVLFAVVGLVIGVQNPIRALIRPLEISAILCLLEFLGRRGVIIRDIDTPLLERGR